MRSSSLLPAALITIALAAPAAAQRRALVFSARGGGFSALTDLNDSPSADLKTGFSLGGAARLEVNRYLAIRGDFTFGRSEFRVNDLGSGTHLNEFFYGGALQLQYPTPSGLTPYLFGGGGAVTIHEENTSGHNKTKGAGSFGLGVSYRVPRSRFEVFAEGSGLVYEHKNFAGATAGFDKTQFNAAYSGGISYRIRL